MALREGGVLVTLDMGGDPLKVTVRPNSVRFDDNQWHTVTVHRTVKEVSVTEGLNVLVTLLLLMIVIMKVTVLFVLLLLLLVLVLPLLL